MRRRDLAELVSGIVLLALTALVIHLHTPIPRWALLSWLGMLAAAFVICYVDIMVDEARKRAAADH